MGNRAHGEEIGGTPSAELRCYRKMRERCLTESCKDYSNYGGRGIVICDRWLNNFANFLADMGRRPTSKHTIERVDVNGPYSPENCVWLPRAEQNRNTRANVRVTYRGAAKLMSDWLRDLEIPRTSFYRYKSQGLTPQTIFEMYE